MKRIKKQDRPVQEDLILPVRAIPKYKVIEKDKEVNFFTGRPF